MKGAKTGGKKKGYLSEGHAAECREILKLKGQGASDDQIRQRLGLRARVYKVRMTQIREHKLFRKAAQDAADEVVNRMMATRERAWALHMSLTTKKGEDGKLTLTDGDKAANAAVGYLRVCSDIDQAIPKVCQQLGFVAVEESDSAKKVAGALEKLGNLTDAELAERYRQKCGDY